MMSETAAWYAAREKWKTFCATPIGSAFMEFDNAHAHLHQLGVFDTVSEKTLRSAAEKEKFARKKLLTLLYESAGVGPYDGVGVHE